MSVAGVLCVFSFAVMGPEAWVFPFHVNWNVTNVAVGFLVACLDACSAFLYCLFHCSCSCNCNAYCWCYLASAAATNNMLTGDGEHIYWRHYIYGGLCLFKKAPAPTMNSPHGVYRRRSTVQRFVVGTNWDGWGGRNNTSVATSSVETPKFVYFFWMVACESCWKGSECKFSSIWQRILQYAQSSDRPQNPVHHKAQGVVKKNTSRKWW